MYRIREADISKWVEYNGLEFIHCSCGLAGDSKRREVKRIIRDLKRDNPDIEARLFNSLHNVRAGTFPNSAF
jgi:tRNA(Ile)-lysidine synthase TilS/MesJ